jgi:hypothetical protein
MAKPKIGPVRCLTIERSPSITVNNQPDYNPADIFDHALMNMGGGHVE